jgi:hypothetical protein
MDVAPEERYAEAPSWISAGAEVPAEWAEDIARMETAKTQHEIAAVARPKRKQSSQEV